MESQEDLWVYCHTCQDTRILQRSEVELLGVEDDGWDDMNVYWDDDMPVHKNEDWQSSKSSFAHGQGSFFTKCRHLNFPVAFPDGVTVYASSARQRDKDDDSPDFGLYLDTVWVPRSMAYQLDWPDYGLPNSWSVAAQSIVDVYQKAAHGLWVEVGCIGGHGRTGTVLSCMAVLAGVKPSDAVEWVRKNYCDHAVETSRQEWWVEWFGSWVLGGSIPALPNYDKKSKEITYTTFDTVYDGIGDWRKFDAVAYNARGVDYPDTSQAVVNESYFVDDLSLGSGKVDYPEPGEYHDDPVFDGYFMEEYSCPVTDVKFKFNYLSKEGRNECLDLLDSLDNDEIEYVADRVNREPDNLWAHIDMTRILGEFKDKVETVEKDIRQGSYTWMAGSLEHTKFHFRSGFKEHEEIDRLLSGMSVDTESWLWDQVKDEREALTLPKLKQLLAAREVMVSGPEQQTLCVGEHV